eukprot:TRINITY_DN13472_c0_g3_i1.p1 TRINITY_DN13472_c0_g3~~TRINITY_DN13472_c0_g3_i1.p1  ORF type:complete len:172 (+),score=54.69 TRINITY_DN13472_c0_g3_i1:94-609(+)
MLRSLVGSEMCIRDSQAMNAREIRLEQELRSMWGQVATLQSGVQSGREVRHQMEELQNCLKQRQRDAGDKISELTVTKDALQERAAGVGEELKQLQIRQEWPEDAVQTVSELEAELALAIEQRLALVRLVQTRGVGTVEVGSDCDDEQGTPSGPMAMAGVVAALHGDLDEI